MNRLIGVGLICAALLCAASAAEERFTSSVSQEDLAAAGLAELTPAQRARLNALVEAYKSGALATARRAADEALAARQAAEAQAARSEAKARAETAKADAARAEAAKAEVARVDAAKAEAARADAAKAEVARAEAARAAAARAEAAKADAMRAEAVKSAQTAGLLAKAKGLLKSNRPAEKLVVESSIPGKFRGWEARQIFTLANGQRWQVANNESYYTPAVENPKVQIVPASMAGYWLRFPDLDTQVRVNNLGDK